MHLLEEHLCGPWAEPGDTLHQHPCLASDGQPTAPTISVPTHSSAPPSQHTMPTGSPATTTPPSPTFPAPSAPPLPPQPLGHSFPRPLPLGPACPLSSDEPRGMSLRILLCCPAAPRVIPWSSQAPQNSGKYALPSRKPQSPGGPRPEKAPAQRGTEMGRCRS